MLSFALFCLLDYNRAAHRHKIYTYYSVVKVLIAAVPIILAGGGTAIYFAN